MAGRRQHATRGVKDLRLEIVGESIGEDHHGRLAVPVVDIGSRQERIAAPLRQSALLGEAEV